MQLGQVHFSRQSGTKTFSKTFFKTCLKALLRKTRKKTPTAADFCFRLFGSFFLQLQTAQIMAAVLQISDSKQALTFFLPDTILIRNVLAKIAAKILETFSNTFSKTFSTIFLKTLPPKPEKRQKRRPKTFFAIFRPFFSSTFIAFYEKN